MQPHDKKRSIRKGIAEHKKLLSEVSALTLSQKICESLAKTDVFQKSSCIALYYAMNDEVRTSEFIEEWYKKKTIVLPVITDENINFHIYKGTDNIIVGMSGIMEPFCTEQIPIGKIDLFIVPGVAFDRQYNRMGRGKGYYDRYLSGSDKPKTGICFDFQLFEQIPTEGHDIKMDMIITENVILPPHRQ